MENDISAKIYDPALYFFIRPIRMTVLRELLPYKDKTILDLCCGTGNQAKLLAKHGFTNLHCLDLSMPMLEIAKKSEYPIRIYNEDATQTHFDDESFDIITISFAIHEKDRITQKNLINEIHRLLKREGILLVVDFAFDERAPKRSRIAIRLVEKMAGGEHYKNFESYIQNNGLTSIIPQGKFTLLKDIRNPYKAISISLYQKS
jgi:demethylmenaquinone methyltransferase/2-methoxy-6-polyprenyl-1,4-benzoquinol methylase